ncbi:putative polyprotein [Tanacetum coccineum]
MIRCTEKVCAYASGKFTNVQSTIDAEINACINTLEKLKIYYLDKQEITLRTDCQAIISFYKKTSSSKASRVRWMKFADAVTGTGVKIEIEHIEGKHNVLADSLSRLVNSCITACTAKEKESQMKKVTRAAAVAVDNVLTMKDLQPLPPNVTRTIQTQEPAGEYKRIQREAHTYPINVDTAYALERIAATMETTAIKNAVSALTEKIAHEKPGAPSISVIPSLKNQKDASDNINLDPGGMNFLHDISKCPRMDSPQT